MDRSPPTSGSSVVGPPARVYEAYLAACDSEAAVDELRSAACAFVRQLRDDGMAPEQVIVQVKSALTDHGRRSYPTYNSDDVRERLADRVIRWCIEAYFAPSPS